MNRNYIQQEKETVEHSLVSWNFPTLQLIFHSIYVLVRSFLLKFQSEIEEDDTKKRNKGWLSSKYSTNKLRGRVKIGSFQSFSGNLINVHRHF